MSKRKRQVEHALLESWRPPRGAGDPVGCLATTFTFDAGFFEEECLARFLEIDSLPDREGLAYLLEKENRLGPTYAGVLVEHRQSGVDHSLRWDVLSVRIPRGKQHAKISLLSWTNHVRIVIASANLTPHGYRFNHEVAGTIELSPDTATHALLEESTAFLDSLLGFVPGSANDPASARAADFVEQVRRQVGAWPDTRRRGTRLDQHLAFTLPPGGGNRAAQSSLTSCVAVCRRYGTSPAEVWAASPFFDPAKPNKDDLVSAELCKSMARGGKRRLTLCVPTLGKEEGGIRLAAPRSLLDTAARLVDRLSVATLPKVDKDKNNRPWHAKMLALSTDKYNALMIGSSNFTKAGMGVGGVFNAEANLIYITRREAFAREAGALDECWPDTTVVDDPKLAEWAGPQTELVEEENSAAPAIPLGFVSARYRAGDGAAILITLSSGDLPSDWQILGGLKHEEVVLDSVQYEAQNRPSFVEAAWPHSYAPGKLLVKWGAEQAFWAVNVEDQAKLPVPREIESMTAQDLLYILAATDASAAFRAWARQRNADSEFDEELDTAVPPDLDPLRRYNLQDTFLRRVSRQARLLAALQRNLERPVWSEQALKWRLSGMIGVERLADRMARGLQGENGQVSESVLSLADLLLMLGEVKYRESETALSRRKFNRLFKQFLTGLVDDLDARVNSSRQHIPNDVRQFWTRVRRQHQA